ncbi:MAG: hypothetical protein WC750_02735 [Patescibacteria group bacterium]|jgi:hypothetical protein
MTTQEKLQAAYDAVYGQVYLDALSNALRGCGFQGQLHGSEDFLALNDLQADEALRVFGKCTFASVSPALVMATMRR